VTRLEGARWFAGMARPGPADVWRVRVDGLWLRSDPSCSGGLDDEWMISSRPIARHDIELVERGVPPRSDD
jgi:hypothetical protein